MLRKGIKLVEVLAYEPADGFGVDKDLIFCRILGIGVGIDERNIYDAEAMRIFFSSQFGGILDGKVVGFVDVGFPDG